MASRFSEGLRSGVAFREAPLIRAGKEQQLKTQRQDLLIKRSGEANKAIEGVLDFASKLGEAFQAGKTQLTPEQYQEQVNNIMNVALRTSQLGAGAGLSVMPPELIEGQRKKLLSTSTPEQKAATEGKAKVAGVKGVASAANIPESRALQAAGLDLKPGETQGGKVTISDLVVPLLMKVQLGGTKSLSDNEWATLELAARHSSGVDVEINRMVRDALNDRGEAVAPADVKKRFAADKNIPKGSKLGMKTEKGFEVLDAKGNLVGYFK